MWCDGFDFDLYELLPEAREILKPAAGIKLKTRGGLGKDGRLDHPSVWNGDRDMIAFFGFRDPGKPSAYWTDKMVVECTFEEAVRDCWVHHYGIVVENHMVWSAPRGVMMALLFHARRIRPLHPETAGHYRESVRTGLRKSVKYFMHLCERYGGGDGQEKQAEEGAAEGALG